MTTDDEERVFAPIPKLAFTFEEAAAATGYGKTVIKMAVRRGDIIPSYANSKPVIRLEELQHWLEALPAEPWGGRHGPRPR
jgi:hypothetical protein